VGDRGNQEKTIINWGNKKKGDDQTKQNKKKRSRIPEWGNVHRTKLSLFEPSRKPLGTKSKCPHAGSGGGHLASSSAVGNRGSRSQKERKFFVKKTPSTKEKTACRCVITKHLGWSKREAETNLKKIIQERPTGPGSHGKRSDAFALAIRKSTGLGVGGKLGCKRKGETVQKNQGEGEEKRLGGRKN